MATATTPARPLSRRSHATVRCKRCASLKLALQKAARSLILLKDGGGLVEVRIFGPDKG